MTLATLSILAFIVGATIVIRKDIAELSKKIDKYQAYIGQIDDEIAQLKAYYVDDEA